MNVAEVIPYKSHKEKFKIVFQELRKTDMWKFGTTIFIQQKNGG